MGRALGSLAGDRLATLLQVLGRDVGGLHRLPRSLEGRQRAQLVLAFAHIPAGEGDVAVEERVGPGLLGHVEGDLIAARDERREARRRLGGEPLQRLVEHEVAHAPRFRPSVGASCACTDACSGRVALSQTVTAAGSDEGATLGLIVHQPAPAVAAHVLDQRHQRLTFLGQRVLDPRRHLGEGAADDDPLLFQRPQPQREGPAG